MKQMITTKRAMKTKVVLLIGFLIGLCSCEKENSKIKDYRDEVIGEYKGKCVKTYWIDTLVAYGHDTTDVILNLSKSDSDSIVDLDYSSGFSFTYKDGEFISDILYMPAILTLQNDDLYFKHQPGKAPVWYECYAKRIQ